MNSKKTVLKKIDALQGFAPLFIRLAFGYHLLFYSWEPVTNLTAGENSTFLASLGIPFPVSSSWIYILAEFIGGFLLIVGFKTRWVAIPLAVIFFVASFLVHGSDPYEDSFQAIQMLAVSLFFFFNGSGFISVDFYLKNRKIVVLP